MRASIFFSLLFSFLKHPGYCVAYGDRSINIHSMNEWVSRCNINSSIEHIRKQSISKSWRKRKVGKDLESYSRVWTGQSPASQVLPFPPMQLVATSDSPSVEEQRDFFENYKNPRIFYFLKMLIYWLIWERERERGRETLICCSTHGCIHWLLLVCALTWDRTYNLGVSGWRSHHGATQPGLHYLWKIYS